MASRPSLKWNAGKILEVYPDKKVLLVENNAQIYYAKAACLPIGRLDVAKK